MSLLKSGLLNGIAVMVRIATGLILNKILAVFIGPSGYAVIGQFQSFVTMVTGFASGGINNGVTKYTAEYYDNEPLKKTIWRTAAVLSTICVLLAAVVVILSRDFLARYVLKDIQHSSVFIYLGVSLVLVVWNGLILAILNGLKQLRQFVIINIAGSLIGLAVTSLLLTMLGIKGALIAIAINQAIIFFAAVFVCRKSVWFTVENLVGKIDRAAAKKLSGFALMALVSAVCIPGSQIFVREYLGVNYGWDAAGYWQAVTRISDIYLMLITTILSFYYMPRLSEIKKPQELKDEVLKAYSYLLPFACLLAAGIYFTRGFITKLLFSESFLPMQSLFFWQLAGDLMKIGSWLLAFLMLARAMTKRYIFTEVVFSISYVGLVVIFTKKMGLEGAVFAFFVNYSLYWIIMYFLCSGELNEEKKN